MEYSQLKCLLLFFFHMIVAHIASMVWCLLQVIVIVERVIASIDKIDENTSNTMLAKVLRLVHRKLTKFHASCAVGIDKLDIEECLKDESNEAQQVKFEILESRPKGSLLIDSFHDIWPQLICYKAKVLVDQSKGPIKPLWTPKLLVLFIDPLSHCSPTQLYVQTSTGPWISIEGLK